MAKVKVVLGLLLCSIAYAQQCIVPFELDSVGLSDEINNTKNGCTFWVVTYNSSGFSGLSLLFQSASVTVGGDSTSWATFSGTTISGSNPNTATTSALSTFSGYYPFVRLSLTSVTGTGKVRGVFYGWRSAPTSDVYTAEVTLTSNQILNLFTTPVTIIPAPPANKIIQTLGCYGRMNYGGTTYVLNGGTVSVAIGGSATASVCGSGFGTIIQATSSQAGFIAASTTGVSSTVAAGTAMTIQKTSANITTGNGTFYVAITYKLIDAQ